ncbi:CinA family protein [Pseudidiomarina terrestris]|uniref:CinA family protein n=1 Tax=Pseudidiomarina terrestris TaxID=2820060 RepID=A0AAW7QW11_9GAMM|nr:MULTISPECIES: CinA family protein [unclassified Pseudidiomarina]MDN7123606.1 CinA family protein [Pseudidiomarina sp. 1APP75-32.1]MDN7128670.1 CinA family protein [Pseudidiomarina sp. 1APR75-15]MDN7135071.1 CinA family protein [Pseudidiomarina sp. 1ASP75-5]MDN7137742.1 CinA family protein [Pseudidiomarina sp. 1ASP75-14]MEA3587150.1 CinA family protein [Pseudidiomarina sp. 1APP75-27a]
MVTQSHYDLAQEIGRWLTTKNWQITTAESCTGGGIGYALTSVPGSSAWFEGGFITYSNRLKQDLLGVPEATLNEFGAVSAETAEAMAQGARQAAGTELAIAVTGLAGPGGGSVAKPVGLVWFGLAWPTGTRSWAITFDGDREAVRNGTIAEALRCFEKIS